MAKKKNNKTAPLTKKQKCIFLIVFWGLFLSGILSVVIVFVQIANGKIGYLPPIEELQNPKNKFASEIISADGERIGTFFSAKDNRINTPYHEISPNVINALIATEDARFLTHSGIDGEALLRVLVKRGILQQKNEGTWCRTGGYQGNRRYS